MSFPDNPTTTGPLLGHDLPKQLLWIDQNTELGYMG